MTELLQYKEESLKVYYILIFYIYFWLKFLFKRIFLL